MKLTMTIDLDNAAFHDPITGDLDPYAVQKHMAHRWDVAVWGAVERAAHSRHDGVLGEAVLRDVNGNTVGAAEVTR